MAQNKTKRKAGNRNLGLKVLSIILAALFVGTAIACAIGWVNVKHLQEQIKSLVPSTEDTPGGADGDDAGDAPGENSVNEAMGGLDIKDGETHGVRMSLARIAVEDYEEYGIEAQAETAYTITATVLNEAGEAESLLQDVTYSLAWAGEKSESVSNFVGLVQNGMKATLTCLKAFDTEITLSCTSTLSPSVKGTKTLGYLKRLESLNCTVQGETVSVTNGGIITVSMPAFSTSVTSTAFTSNTISIANGVNFGTGTENPTFKIDVISVSFHTTFANLMSRNYTQTYSVYPCKGRITATSAPLTTSIYNLFETCGGSSDNQFKNSASVRADVYRAAANVAAHFVANLSCTYNGETTAMLIGIQFVDIVAPSEAANVNMDGGSKLIF